MTENILQTENLEIKYRMSGQSDVTAVSNCSFEIEAGEYFGLVGESGCGKSTVAKSIIGTLDPNGEITSGRILFKGEPIHDYSEREFRQDLRWKEIAFIPQASMNSLDPLTKISSQAIEIGRRHTDWSKSKTLDRLRELFEIVGLSESRIDDYPHQLSGGMQQRVVISLALLLEPSLIIADEPTTALDVIMQDKILSHFEEIKGGNFSLLLITHDIAVVLEDCNAMAVLHSGQTAEVGAVERLYNDPRHPYTKMLREAFPDVRYPDRRLVEIQGTPPELTDEVNYCTYADRCPMAVDECRAGSPPLEAVKGEPGHFSSCIRSDEIDSLSVSEIRASGREQREETYQSEP